jgi:predicted MFS family arabinose efflux permease
MSAETIGYSKEQSTGQAFGSPGYRNYVLIALTLVYTLNFIDRILITVVAQPIIDEFKLQDWQFGLLSGFGFALMYTIAGIPIARLAESVSRVRIIAASVIIWSAMTALCGIAGSFLALLIFRIGVGIGEAGCTPPANSIIADYFPPRSRARALGIYAGGITLGGVLANLFGGPIAQAYTWREAFLILGIPGILIGIIVWVSIKEPPRGYSDPVGTPLMQKASITETLKLLSGKRSFWLNVAAATAAAFAGYSFTGFQAPFFQRVHGLSLAEVAIQISVPLGIAATAGTFIAGSLTERLSQKYPSVVAWLPGILLIVSVPLYFIALSLDNPRTASFIMIAAALSHYSYLGAQYTICQGLADARSRATAIAIMLFIVNLIGYGLGPLTVGILSDLFAGQNLTGTNLSLSMCKGTDAELLKTIGQTQLETCRTAGAEGLRLAMQCIAFVFGLAGIFFLMTSRTLDKDLVAGSQ